MLHAPQQYGQLPAKQKFMILKEQRLDHMVASGVGVLLASRANLTPKNLRIEGRYNTRNNHQSKACAIEEPTVEEVRHLKREEAVADIAP